jgi:hypothetical protein
MWSVEFRRFRAGLVLACALAIAACASVPPEVVELSARVGTDTNALRSTYVDLIQKHFDALRADRERYLDEEWTPLYLSKWVSEGRLVEVAQGQIVWSVAKEEFVAPTSHDADSSLLETVRFWSEAAIDEIGNKRKALVEPLDVQERQLLAWVGAAFDQISQGNAVITAHLNSLRKVQSAQDELLETLDIKDLRDKINNTIASASDKAAEGLEAVRKADGLVEKAEKILHPR